MQTSSKKSFLSIPDLEAALQAEIQKLPSAAPIYLPTERFPVEDAVEGLKRANEIYQTRLDSIYRPRLRALRKKYAGSQRCFVIGNGPSLNLTDLSMLKDEITFAVNGFFLKSRELDWVPTFYVVEDHLVAEDRRDWINAFTGPIKLFPVYLAYCLKEAEDTIFYNHRPRVSYPHGFDFSTEADRITYTGCTVTFSCLQLAHYLGFRETYLIGVDADYELPKDVDKSQSYGVGVLDMKSDDPNHFHPDYFGKGFRWHDPQVHKMMEAYAEAEKVTRGATHQRIYNAGIGGKLEVFERRSFASLFPNARTAKQMEDIASTRKGSCCQHTLDALQARFSAAPKVLFIDGETEADATLSALLEKWPPGNRIFINSAGHKKVEICHDDGSYFLNICESDLQERLNSSLRAFSPVAILYRLPPDAGWLHTVAMSILRELSLPFAVWIGTDWADAFDHSLPESFSRLEQDLHWLLQHAIRRYCSNCNAMSEALEHRYGYPFEVFHEGIDSADWSRFKTRPPGPVKICCPVSLVENGTLDALAQISQAVELLFRTGTDISLEINIADSASAGFKDRFYGRASTRFVDEEFNQTDFRAWLSEADIVTIACPFDMRSAPRSLYCLDHHLSTCLASSAPLLAVGPSDAATMAFLEKIDCGIRVNESSSEYISSAIEKLISQPFIRLELAEKAQEAAFTTLNDHDLSLQFLESFRSGLREGLIFNTEDHQSNRTCVNASESPIALTTASIPLPSASRGERLPEPAVPEYTLSSDRSALERLHQLENDVSAGLASLNCRINSLVSGTNQSSGMTSAELKACVGRFKNLVDNIKEHATDRQDALDTRIAGNTARITSLEINLSSLEVESRPTPETDIEHRIHTTRIIAEARTETNDMLERVEAMSQTLADMEARGAATQDSLLVEFGALRADFDEVTQRVNRMQERIQNELLDQKPLEDIHEMIQPDIKNLQNQFQLEVKELTAAVETGFNNRLESLQTSIAKLTTTLDETTKLAQRIKASEPANNSIWFQHFNRQLTKTHIDTLLTEWKKRLSFNFSEHTLGYMAHRACHIESLLQGRFATSIEDILLRVLVGKSVKGPTLKILEIGTLFGVGAAVLYDTLAAHYNRVHMTLIDPLDGYYDASTSDILTGLPVNESMLRHNLSVSGLSADDYTLIKLFSSDLAAIKAASEARYDVLVIDGDHSYAGVKTDFENYASFVRLGGYIIFDDYGSAEWPDVQRFVDKEIAGVKQVALVGASWRTCVYRVVKPRSKSRVKREPNRQS